MWMQINQVADASHKWKSICCHISNSVFRNASELSDLRIMRNSARARSLVEARSSGASVGQAAAGQALDPCMQQWGKCWILG